MSKEVLRVIFSKGLEKGDRGLDEEARDQKVSTPASNPVIKRRDLTVKVFISRLGGEGEKTETVGSH